MRSLTLTCPMCSRQFQRGAALIARGARYCSKGCHSRGMRTCADNPCSECGHRSAHAKGLCQACYKRRRAREVPEFRQRVLATAARSRDRRRDSLKRQNRVHHSRHHFGGRDLLTLQRDDYRCMDCGDRQGTAHGDRLDVHHVDGTGHSTGLASNNDLSNLVSLCRSCHRKRHQAMDRSANHAAT